jgi:succinyl-CoA--D-citramalate CoA-transferase
MTQGPLKDVRVVELASFIAGPYCGQLLADLGAEVIKIELPEVGDPMRQWGVQAEQRHSVWWSVIGRNKKSVTLDVRTPDGQRIARQLLAKADVFLENFRPGTLEEWNLGYEQAKSVNPRLIMVRISGFGQTGPYSDKASFGSVAEAIAGLRYLTGYPDRPPVRVGLSIGDTLAGLFGALGTLAALHRRDTDNGTGQRIDVAITESVLAVLESVLAEASRFGVVRERSGSILPGVAPSNAYPTRDGKWVIIGANADTIFRRLAQAMGKPALAEDPRFATHRARGTNQSEIDQVVAEWTAQHERTELLATLDAHSVPAGPINSAQEVVSDPHFLAREAVVKVLDSVLGEVTMQGTVPKFSETPAGVRWTGPRLGEHNEEIYCGLLGMTRGELEGLRQKRVV